MNSMSKDGPPPALWTQKRDPWVTGGPNCRVAVPGLVLDVEQVDARPFGLCR